MRRLAGVLIAWILLGMAPAVAQVSGTVFDDRNANGLLDAGEEPLSGVTIRVFGRADAGTAVDTSVTTGSDGKFTLNPGNGCYLLSLADPAGWRRTQGRTDGRESGSAGYQQPAGVRRFGSAPQLIDNLRAGTVRFTSMGDSIGYNWNSCFDTNSFWYSSQIRDRLQCVAPAASIPLDKAAVKGEHTDDLLIDDGKDLNNVFAVLRANSQLVTISIIGNDMLNDEPPDNPTPEQTNRAVAELLDSRANLQEILSSLVAGLPGAEIELNTLYDNLAYGCATSTFHRDWLPLMNQILRELAWGQARRVTNAEIFTEFAHQDLLNGCQGFRDQICNFLGDGIHPKGSGYSIIREKVWEALDGVNLGPKDGNGASNFPGANHGYLQRVIRLYPTRTETRNGATVTNPAAAFSEADGGAAASVQLGIGEEEVRFFGFPDWYDEITPVKVLAGIRYKTGGTVTDDFYRVEASVNDQFRPPAGFNYSATNWIFYTPLVGSGGPNAPAEAPDYSAVPVLVTPNVSSFRVASASLLKNPVLSTDGRGYDWPALTRTELGQSQIRVVSAPVARTAGDSFDVQVDAAWLDIYGTIKPRPAEVKNLMLGRGTGASLVLTFDVLMNSEIYNIYAGTLSALRPSGAYDHGQHTWCNSATSPAGPNRLSTTIPGAEIPPADSYFLVTGRVDGVESPAGFSSTGKEIDRSLNRCP